MRIGLGLIEKEERTEKEKRGVDQIGNKGGESLKKQKIVRQKNITCSTKQCKRCCRKRGAPDKPWRVCGQVNVGGGSICEKKNHGNKPK